jgi:hypothetical protein
MAAPKTDKSASARVGKIIDRLEKVHPDARLALDFTNPLELLIALILAAQARDDLVCQVTAGLFKKYRNAEDYARAPLPELEEQIRKISALGLSDAELIDLTIATALFSALTLSFSRCSRNPVISAITRCPLRWLPTYTSFPRPPHTRNAHQLRPW